MIMQWIKNNLRSLINPTIIELGASFGVESAWFWNNLDHPYLYCVEPDPRNIAQWKARCSNLPITLIEAAVSDKDGETDLFLSGGKGPVELGIEWSLSSSIRKPKEHLVQNPGITFDKRARVVTRSLDSICAEFNLENIDFIWADIQGAEVDMIKGGQEALKHTKFLYTEFSDNEIYEGQIGLQQILNMLPTFEIVFTDGENMLLRNNI